MQGSRIFLSGGTGFLGTSLRLRLARQGCHVALVSRSNLPYIQSNEIAYECDLVDRQSLLTIVDTFRPDYVVHLADAKNRSYSTTDSQEQSNNLSIIASRNLTQACLCLPNLKRFIFTGTCDEYGVSQTPFHEDIVEAPVNPYGKAKLAITKSLLDLHQSVGFPVAILRPSIIYGPRQGIEMFLPALIQSLKAGRSFPMTPGEQYRDFVFIDDVVDAILKSLHPANDINGIIMNIASGTSIQIKEVAFCVSQLISPLSFNLIKFGALPYRKNEIMNYSVNIDRARNLIDWIPRIEFAEGIALTLKDQKSLNH
jgi:UDP-glucose 4-epimerase